MSCWDRANYDRHAAGHPAGRHRVFPSDRDALPSIRCIRTVFLMRKAGNVHLALPAAFQRCERRSQLLRAAGWALPAERCQCPDLIPRMAMPGRRRWPADPRIMSGADDMSAYVTLPLCRIKDTAGGRLPDAG